MKRTAFIHLVPLVGVLGLMGCPKKPPGPITVPYPGPASATICKLYTYNATTPVPGTITSQSLPPWLTLTEGSTSITLAGTPQGNDWGTWPLAVTGNDSTGTVVTVTGSISVAPPPTISVSPASFKWKGPSLSQPVTITVTPACTYTITAAVEKVEPTSLSFTPLWTTRATDAAGVANLRVQASKQASNDEGDVLLTISSNQPGTAPVTKVVKIQYLGP